jgi:hypothetical protein
VDVTVTNGEYSFDFAKLARFMDIAMKNGMQYFEHAHFFTQWGAKHAPKIMATVDGRYKRIFGWDTVAWGKRYTAFLRAYVTALLAFLKERGLDRRFIYHVSDEPSPKNREDYRRAKEGIADLLTGYTVCDALSHYEFYEDGTVTTPIAVTNNLDDFYGRTKNLWGYYTGGLARRGMPNRKLNTSGERNRMFGVQMYMYELEGFLHWGYNYWYGPLSQGMMDPRTDPGVFSGGSPGAAFVVYPGEDGKPLCSLRFKTFRDAHQDVRALRLLESKIGYEKTLEIIENKSGEPLSFVNYERGIEVMLAKREAVNKAIEENL